VESLNVTTVTGHTSNRLGAPPRGADFGGVHPCVMEAVAYGRKKVSLAT
jgi:hypothetical protein